MTWEIYALRVTGTHEARYIGQSGKSAAGRLAELDRFARKGHGNATIRPWLNENRGRIECIVIGTAGSEAEARDVERLAVQLFSSFGHRLFNRQLISPALRLAPWRTTLEQIEPWTPNSEARAA